jgi:two-component system, NarL family, nitrate/nitrite response regulator NarL
MFMGENTEAVSILIADAHRVLRDRLRKLLEAEPGFHVVGEASDEQEAVRLVRQIRPDIVLLDLCMRRRTGFDVLRELTKSSTPVRTIVLAAAIEQSEVVEAIELGARAVVLKQSAGEALVECVRNVVAGRYWVGEQSASDLVQILRSLLPQAVGSERKTFGLTSRELQVIGTVIAGYNDRDIAQNLKIREETVKRHLTRIFTKLDVSNRLELVLFAIAHRLKTLL